jgi:glyoxylase-like metal-dependent hydrolase (beta-lactamase superfamily II)
MQTTLPRLHASEPLDLGFGVKPLQARAYVLQRPEGNLAIYGSAALEPELDAVRDLGGLTAQYLNHAHEASPAAARVRDALGAPLHVHEADAEEARAQVPVDATFTERHMVGDDLEVIPVPGHTPGATAYLWSADGRRVLFTGDTVFVRDGEWVAALLDGVSDRDTYVASVELLTALDFDLLVPGIAPIGEEPVHATDADDARDRLGRIAERLRSGLDH